MRFTYGLLIGLLISMTILACAAGSKSYKPRPRRDQSKLYVPCRPEWTDNPEGRWCSRTCLERSKIKHRCKEWSLTIKTWDFFRESDYAAYPRAEILKL